jgi:dolichol-phosphate mannosyltransferase
VASTRQAILHRCSKSLMSEPLTIVVPVYNEGANFASLWAAINSQIRSEFNVLVVYDFDEDDTIPVAEQIIAQGETQIRLVKNNVKPGVIGAILTGFNQVERGPVLVVMADLSDDLHRVNQMLDLYRQGNHIVVGSRYMRGGRLVGGPWFKQSLSKFAGLTLHWFRGIPTHDSTNAFKLYDGEMLKALTIESQGGFELGLEITVKAFLTGYRITEIPATWRDRTHGQSRFRLWAWMPQYLKWYLYAFRPRQAPRQSLLR